MNVGIMTFHAADNYGAVLQCRALHDVLRSMGHRAYVIDYRPEYITAPYQLWKKDWWMHPVGTVKNLFKEEGAKKRAEGFNRFRNRMDLVPYPPTGLDAVIFGSDQIWNPELTGGDAAFFASTPEFASTRNIAYAASSGSVRLSGRIAFDHFYRLGVREPQLQQYLQAKGLDAKLVLDPVLLAGREIMDAMASPCPEKPGYVLTYEAIDHPDVKPKARVVACGRKVVSVARTARCEGTNRYGPGEFISLVREADYIVTTSFHAVALAILYGKPYDFISSGTGKDDRIKNITARGTDLEALRRESLSFLKEALQ